MTDSDNIDYLSQLPIELLEQIFHFCSETNDHGDGNTFVQYQYFPDHRLYREYQGDLAMGVPSGRGRMYQGTRFYSEIKDEHLEKGFQTPWIYLPLLYVYPKFEPKLSLLSYKN